MKTMKAQLWLDIACTLGEGPIWREDSLWFVDIDGGTLIQARDGAVAATHDMGQMIGAVAPATDGRLLVALEKEAFLYDTQKRTFEPAGKYNDNDRMRANDGKPGPCGRFYAGTMAKQNRDPLGGLWRLERGKAPVQVLDGILCSNGLCWSPDEKTVYYNDSPTRNVYAFDYDRATGDFTNQRICLTMAEGEGTPDGMTIDTEGMLWIAQWNGWQVGRYNPKTAEKLMKIDVPVSCTTCPVFGGEDLRTLYITTAQKSDAEGQSHAGAVFRCTPGAQGIPAYAYKV